MQHQHVERSTIVVVDSPSSVGPDDLDGHAGAASASAANGVGRINLNDPIGRAGRGSMTKLASPDEIGIVFSFRWRTSFNCRRGDGRVYQVTARLECRRMLL